MSWPPFDIQYVPQPISEPLVRYGVTWPDTKHFLLTPKEDGHWTPWWVADEKIKLLQDRIEELEAKNAQLEVIADSHSCYVL